MLTGLFVETLAASEMPAPATTKYRTTNWKGYNAALKRRGSLMAWFDPEIPWLNVTGNGKRGRDATFSDATIQFCQMVKALYG